MFPDLKRALIQLKNDWRPNRIIIEDKVSGIQLIQEARVLGINVTSYTPSSRSDKETRLHAQTSPFENGRVLLPTGASWLSDYIIELTGFPGAKYDDQVDSTTQFLDYMTSHQPFVVTQEMVDQARRAPPYRRPRSMT
jgi:predicted phage terminase large subunit-like protein